MIDSKDEGAQSEKDNSGQTDIKQASMMTENEHAPQFSMDQLMNTDLLLSGELFDPENKQRQTLLKGTLTDFTLSSIHSIVPLMNLTELFLLSPASAVDLLLTQKEVSFLSGLAVAIARTHNSTQAAFRSAIQLLEAAIQAEDVFFV